MLDDVSTNKLTRSTRKAKRPRTPKRRSPRTADEFFALPEQFQSDWDDTLRVISKMRTDGLSLKKAAKQEGVNPRTVTQLGRQALRKRKNRSYSVTERDSLLRVMNVITPEGPIEVGIRSSKDARLLGSY